MMMEGSKLRTCAAQASRFGGSAKIQSRRQLPAQHTLTSQSQQLPRQSQQLPRHGVRASCTGSAKTSERSVTRLEGVALAEEAVQAAVQAAAAAFTTDPFVGYYMRDPQQAGGLTAEIVQHILTKGNRGSHLLQTLPDRGGFIAGFQIPDGKPGDMDLEGLAQRYHQGLEGMMDHYYRFQPHQAEYFKEHGPFMYIAFMAVDPKHQGQGLGSLLLKRVCEDADEKGQHLYLEASSEGSRRVYARHGFQDLCTILGPDGEAGPKIYVMARPPCSSGK